jgi:hypothetical protein
MRLSRELQPLMASWQELIDWQSIVSICGGASLSLCLTNRPRGIYFVEHPYRAFIVPPTEMNVGWEKQYEVVCGWGGGTNESQTNFGIVLGGEFSAAINE